MTSTKRTASRASLSFALTMLVAFCACMSRAGLAQSTVTVTQTLPVNMTSATSPVPFAFSASSGLPITGWQVYVDEISQYHAGMTASIQASLSIAPGTHSIIARAWNAGGVYSSANFTLTVVPLSGITVTQSQPANSTSATSPVSFAFAASSNYPITGWQLYVDNVSQYQAGLTPSIQTSLPIAAGTHSIIARAWDSTGAYASSSFSLTVTSPSSITLTKSLPTNTTSAISPVAFAFSAISNYSITGWQLYIDNALEYQAGAASSLQTSLPLTAGTHSVIAKVWDSSGAYASSNFNLTVESPSGLNYYVAPTGNDSNNGSATSPWATLQYAADLAVPGTVVHVAPGTYAGLTSNVGGTATARIRFISDVQWAAKIRTTGVAQVWQNNGSYVDIMGFDVSGDGRLGILNEGSFVRIIGNVVHDIPAATNASDGSGGAGIDNDNYSASDNDVIGNVVHDIGNPAVQSYEIQGIYHANLRGHILNNIVYRAQAWGIQLWHAANAVIIANNLVFQNGEGGIIVGAGDAPGGITDNNTIVVNNMVIYNYSSWGMGRAIYESGSTGTANQYLDNLIWGNSEGIVLQNGLVAVGTINADPQLVNYQPDGSGDYHLRSTSPAVNSGTMLDCPEFDFAGASRPFGSGPDVGVYEFGAAPGVWPYE